ncbi:4657_t:CDS:10 [Ambispora gerdemannii]|uniref:4657_t:CDS:1 n=1 Tax=Ambispora gerdemannii TaxID=144530 RepID=A0A9N8ZSZ5_9GLOM|nr:4657_t:CDS:10 [Ambispora gerdemannii]
MEKQLLIQVDEEYHRIRQEFYNNKLIESQKMFLENNQRIQDLRNNKRALHRIKPIIGSHDVIYPLQEIKRGKAASNTSQKKKAKSAVEKKMGLSSSEFTVQSSVHNGPQVKNNEQLASISLNNWKPLPRYTLWTPIPHSSKTEDDPVLRHLHYFGEEDDNEEEINYMDFYDDIVVGEKTHDLEVVAFNTLRSLFEQNNISINVLENCAASRGLSLCKTLSKSREAKQSINVDEIDDGDEQEQLALAEMLLKASEKILKTSAKNLLSGYLEKISTDKTNQESFATVNTNVDNHLDFVMAETMMRSYASLWCRRCYVYDCGLHGTESRPTKNKKRPLFITLNEPCGSLCYMNEENKRNYQGSKHFEDWNSVEIALYKRAREIYGKKNYCAVSVIVKTKACQQVYQRAQFYESNPNEDDTLGESSFDELKQRGGRLKRTMARISGIEIDAADHLEYRPCDHPGKVCDSTCPCVQGNLFCEKYCRCDYDCSRRFFGCNCSNIKACNLRSCFCFANYRECDPDICSCSACELQISAHDFDRRPCKNTAIQRGKAKHTIVGISAVAGWGLFVKEPVKKNEFLGEYVGEVISQAEADRRGKIYDKRGTSFLFNLNKEKVVDATRKGNKFRFVNHSSDPNSYARVTLVNGEHRIGLYAQFDLDPGQELFFDYRYEGETLKFVPCEREIPAK